MVTFPVVALIFATASFELSKTTSAVFVETGALMTNGSSPKIFFGAVNGPIFGVAFATLSGAVIVAAVNVLDASWVAVMTAFPAPTMVTLPVVAPTVATAGSDEAYVKGALEFEVGSVTVNGASPKTAGSMRNFEIVVLAGSSALFFVAIVVVVVGATYGASALYSGFARLRFSSEGKASIGLLSRPGGALNVVALRSRDSVDVVFVSTPVEDTSRFTTSPLAAATKAVTPPVASAVTFAAGASGVTSCFTTCPLAVVTVTCMFPSAEVSSEAPGPEADATKLPDARVSCTAGSFDTMEFSPTSTGMFALPGVFTCAIPVGVTANKLVVPENFNLLRCFLAPATAGLFGI